LVRHFTASGVVLSCDDSVLLIKHRKLGMWLCPGGHLEPDEDPAQAVVREVAEETGLVCDIVARPWFRHAGTTVLPSPFAICVYDVPSDGRVGPHQHIDMVYVLNPATGTLAPQDSEVSRCEWVPLADIADWDSTPDEVPALVISAAAYASSLARPAWSTPPSCFE
jgi:8-oxo-dGTP diphosphatase